MFWSSCWCSIMNIYDTKKTNSHTHIHHGSHINARAEVRGEKSNVEQVAVIELYVGANQGIISRYLFYCLCTVVAHSHTIWLTAELIVKHIAHSISVSSNCRQSVKHEDLRGFKCLFLMMFTPQPHFLAKWKHNADQWLIWYRKVYSGEKKTWDLIVCFCSSFDSRWHNSLDVRHITL